MTEKCVHVKREKEVLSSKADVVSSLALPVFRSVLVEDRRQKCFFFVSWIDTHAYVQSHGHQYTRFLL